MRTYGRQYQRDASGKIIPGTKPKWVVVETTKDGNNDQVYLTALCQVLQGSLNESPFYASWGLPQKQAVQQQVFPDFNMQLTQQWFAPFFASLIIAKLEDPTPNYRVAIVTKSGQLLNMQVAV